VLLMMMFHFSFVAVVVVDDFFCVLV
jgi:hypothetical protein